MQYGVTTVGSTPAVAISVTHPERLVYGMRLLCRDNNSGDVYLGSTSSVTTSTGLLLPKGPPETSYPFVVPAEHFQKSGGTIYVIGSASSQVVDWSAE